MDMIFKSLLDKEAIIKRTEVSYDNQYNRPENTVVSYSYPCRIARKSNAFLINTGANNEVSSRFRAYFMPDAVVKTGDVLEVAGIKYKAGLTYLAPMNHHLEVDISVVEEA